MLNDRERRSLETETIARITWGDAASEVRAWLMSQQIPDAEADALLRACLRRRASEMRVRGLRDLWFGLPALLGAVAWAIAAYAIMEWLMARQVRLPAVSYGLAFAPAMLAGAYGCWRSIRGLDRVVFGARADGAVSDVE